MVLPLRRQKQILFSLITLVGGTLSVLLLLEGFLRVFYSEIVPPRTSADLAVDSIFGPSAALRPNANGLTGHAQISVDALGFWKYSVRCDSTEDAWLLLGDSVTLGLGIESDSTFAGRLAWSLKKWRLLNASWIGYSSADYLNVALSVIPKYTKRVSKNPIIKRVTVFWTLNDVYSDCGIGLPPGQALRERGGALLGWLRQKYVTYSWLKHLCYDRSRDYFLYDQQYYLQNDARFRSSIAKLDSLHQLCARHSVRMDVIILPYEYQLRQKEKAPFSPQRLMGHTLDSLKIPWKDASLSATLWAQNSKALFLYGDGIHFSNRGHEILFNYLMENTLCDSLQNGAAI